MDKKKESLSKKFGRAYSGFFNTDSGAMAGIFAAIVMSLPGSVFMMEDAGTQAPLQDSVGADIRQAELEKKVEQIAILESMANSFSWQKKERIVAERNYQQAVKEFQTELLLNRKISEDMAADAAALLRKETGRLPVFAEGLQSALVFRDEARAEFSTGDFQALPPEQQVELVKTAALMKSDADASSSLWSALGMGFGTAGGIFGLCLAGNRLRRRFNDEDRAERNRLWEEAYQRDLARQAQERTDVVPVPVPAPVKKKPDHFRL